MSKDKYLTSDCRYCKRPYLSSKIDSDFCSEECCVKATKEKEKKIQRCVVCHGEFTSHQIKDTCSRKCTSTNLISKKLNFSNDDRKHFGGVKGGICKKCGRQHYFMDSGEDKEYCSLECRRGVEKISEEENCLDGKSLEIDSHSCVMCGNVGVEGLTRSFKAHHVDYFTSFRLSNMITLCGQCKKLTDYSKTFWQILLSTLLSGSKVVKKGWGLEIHLANNKDYCLKYLVFFKGKRLSLHEHHLKKEQFVLLIGGVKCYLKDDKKEDMFVLTPGKSVEILPGVLHQVEAMDNSIIVEVSTRDYPEDSIRIEKGD